MLPLDVESVLDYFQRLRIGRNLAALVTFRRSQSIHPHRAFNAIVHSCRNILDYGFALHRHGKGFFAMLLLFVCI
jgi:hypothetical protein